MFLGMALMLLFFAGLMAIPAIAVHRHQKKCRVKVRGKCISLTDPDWPENIPNAPYHPSYEIEYEGEKIILIRTVGKEDGKVQLGKTYDLYIDPDNPQNFVNKVDNNEHMDRVIFAVLCGVGSLILFGIYIISIFLTV